MDSDISEQIQAELEYLNPAAQEQVLNFLRQLNRSNKGTPGKVVASFAGSIDQEDLKQMEEAIEQGCEQVNSRDW